MGYAAGGVVADRDIAAEAKVPGLVVQRAITATPATERRERGQYAGNEAQDNQYGNHRRHWVYSLLISTLWV